MNKVIKLDKNKECATTLVHSLSHDGRGIATVQNKTTFIVGALPDEEVTYKIIKKHSNYNEAEAIDIHHPSTKRATPPCKHFGVCGGCSLQHMTMETQIDIKQQTLLEQLKHFGRVTPQHILAPLLANTVGYRRKARLGVKFVIKKDKLLVGFRERSSRYLAELEKCIVLHPQVGERLTELSQFIRSLALYQYIPQVEVAIGDTDTALVFRHMEPMTDADREQLIAFGKLHHFHIYLQPNPPAALHKIWPTDGLERLTYTLPDYQVEFLFHPLDFTQINLEMNRLMVKQALTLLELTSNDTVLDLFCGIGNFTLPMAKQARQVTGVEGSLDMVNRAKDNALHNHIQNVDFHVANLEAPTLEQAAWLKGQHYDKVLLDPPRAGAKEILPFFSAMGAKRIVYVSCNPATLARDAGELVHQYGYTLTHAGIMNMFPHTSHIEAMAVFCRGDNDAGTNNLLIIDWELATKLAGNKKDVADEILSLFLTSLSLEVSAISDSFKTKELADVLRRVHKLHGASCYCGVPRLKAVLLQLETELKKSKALHDKLTLLVTQLNAETNILLAHYQSCKESP